MIDEESLENLENYFKMKSLEITTKKRLLIVEFDLGQTMGDALEKLNIKKDLDIICRGSDLTEEIAQGMVQESKYMNHAGESGWVDYKVYPDGLIFGAIESFISAIGASGYHWNTNPIQNAEEYNKALNDDKAWNKRRYSQKRLYFADIPTYKQQMKLYNEAESITFHPEKTLIFEIL